MTTSVDITLVAPPWFHPWQPSPALGILKPALEQAGLTVAVCWHHLAWMDHLTEVLPEEDGRSIAEIALFLASSYYARGVGEWVFAVPPLAHPTPEQDEWYRGYLAEHGVGAAPWALLLRLRELAPAFLDRCADQVLATGPRVVGLTCMLSQVAAALGLAARLKARAPELPVVAGGQACSGPMGEALLHGWPWLEAVVRGEGEGVLPGLVTELLAGRPPQPFPGLCTRIGSTPGFAEFPGPLDTLPLPDYGDFYQQLARSTWPASLGRQPALPVLWSRGCWWGVHHHCTFCGQERARFGYRSKSGARVLDELEQLTRRHQVLELSVRDVALNPRHLDEVLPVLATGPYHYTATLEARADRLTRNHLRHFRDARVTLQPGLESLSTPVLAAMNKGLTGLQNIRLLKWCKEYGVKVQWNLLHGTPGEPPAAYRGLARLIPWLSHLPAPRNAVRVGLQRFSPAHEQPAAHGIELLGPPAWFSQVFPASPEVAADLSYLFEFRRLDGQDSEEYARPALDAIRRWQEQPGELTYRRGPGFLKIVDRRPGLPPQRLTLQGDQAVIYLACEDGAGIEDVHRAVDERVRPEDLRRFLDQLVQARQVYEEDGQYLALALPDRPRG